MTARERAIRARREAANAFYWCTPGQVAGVEAAIGCATTVTPEELDRAHEALLERMSWLGSNMSGEALKAAFAAAGFEVQP